MFTQDGGYCALICGVCSSRSAFPALHSPSSRPPAALWALTLQIKNTKWLHASLTWFFLQPLSQIQLSHLPTEHVFTVTSSVKAFLPPTPAPQNPSPFLIDTTVPSPCPLGDFSQFFHNIGNDSVYLAHMSLLIKDTGSFLSKPGI